MAAELWLWVALLYFLVHFMPFSISGGTLSWFLTNLNGILLNYRKDNPQAVIFSLLQLL